MWNPSLLSSITKLWQMSSWIDIKVAWMPVYLFRQSLHCQVLDTYWISVEHMNVAWIRIENVRFSVLFCFSHSHTSKKSATFACCMRGAKNIHLWIVQLENYILYLHTIWLLNKLSYFTKHMKSEINVFI